MESIKDKISKTKKIVDNVRRYLWREQDWRKNPNIRQKDNSRKFLER